MSNDEGCILPVVSFCVERCIFNKRLSNTRRKRLRLRPVSLREAYGLEALHERNHPSTFCGSIFDILRFACFKIDKA